MMIGLVAFVFLVMGFVLGVLSVAYWSDQKTEDIYREHDILRDMVMRALEDEVDIDNDYYWDE